MSSVYSYTVETSPFSILAQCNIQYNCGFYTEPPKLLLIHYSLVQAKSQCKSENFIVFCLYYEVFYTVDIARPSVDEHESYLCDEDVFRACLVRASSLVRHGIYYALQSPHRVVYVEVRGIFRENYYHSLDHEAFYIYNNTLYIYNPCNNKIFLVSFYLKHLRSRTLELSKKTPTLTVRFFSAS